MKTFPELVIEEATNIKKYASLSEIERLDISTLDPQSTSDCVYGQMTGNCHSKRAIELIELCASKVYHAPDGFPRESKELNGAPTSISRRGDNYETKYWSPVEVFIDQTVPKMRAKLVSFLKGEIDTLV